jgi:hypothetical protein
MSKKYNETYDWFGYCERQTIRIIWGENNASTYLRCLSIVDFSHKPPSSTTRSEFEYEMSLAEADLSMNSVKAGSE